MSLQGIEYLTKGSVVLGIGGTELVLILIFGFLIFGPEKLPDMGRTVGRMIRQFRQASDKANAKFKEEIYDPFQEAVEPYKESFAKEGDGLKEDLAAIQNTFKETKDTFKDPLGLKTEFNQTAEQLKDPLGLKKNIEETRESITGAAASANSSQVENTSGTNAAQADAGAQTVEQTKTQHTEPLPQTQTSAEKRTVAASLYGLNSSAASKKDVSDSATSTTQGADKGGE